MLCKEITGFETLPPIRPLPEFANAMVNLSFLFALMHIDANAM
jgi:hypothetical protein